MLFPLFFLLLLDVAGKRRLLFPKVKEAERTEYSDEKQGVRSRTQWTLCSMPTESCFIKSYLQAAAVTAELSSKHELVWVVLGTVRIGLGQQS